MFKLKIPPPVYIHDGNELWKPQIQDIDVSELDNLFQNDELVLLSKIELKNINVD